ncbi:VirB4 family type IV secretion system protein [Ktedonobacter racemifer]|uniref:Type IV secretory pathway VirB4 protein n=1 Tax=Ktedonobacter racemifer DSM 44963 TaxID=485913 RepID=D6TWZ6_KTERA|nr:DUF87 domain-containing protein [Ktedonobacter racemifer]EFH84729.1 Type IV secretory pathway VirB4 protein [Ktedonobacter racemifer DSM 44963]
MIVKDEQIANEPVLLTAHQEHSQTEKIRSERARRQRPPRFRRQHRRSRKHGSVQHQFVFLDHIVQDVQVNRAPLAEEPQERDYLAALEIRATNYTLKSQEERSTMMLAFRALLRSLRFPIQMLIRSKPMDLSSYVEHLHTHTDQWQGEAFEIAVSHERAMRLLGAQRTLIDRRFYLLLTADQEGVQGTWNSSLRRLLSRRARTRARQAHLDEAQQILATRVQAIQHQLAAMGLLSHRLAGKELADLTHGALQGEQALRFPLPESIFALSDKPLARPALDVLSPSSQEEETSFDPYTAQMEETLLLPSARDHLLAPADLMALKDLLAPESVRVTPRYLQVGEEYVRGLAIVGFPREIVEGCLSPLLACDEIFDLCFHFSPQNTAEFVKRLLFRKEQYASTQRMNLHRGRQQDPTLQVAEADVTALIGPLASGEESMLEMGFYLLVRAPDLATLNARTDRLRQILHQHLFVAHPTTLEHAEAFRTCQPTCMDTLGRTFTTTSTVAACTFPFMSESFAMQDGTFVGVTTSGEPVLLNPWVLESPHEFWGGVTGSGKSYAVKLWLLHERFRHPDTQVLILDPSREYERLVDVFGGTILRLSPGSEHAINPFDVLPHGIDMDWYVTTQRRGDRLAEKMTQLHAFLDLLLAEYIPHPTTLSAREKAFLDRAFYECYRRVGITTEPRTHDRQAPFLRDLYDVLKSGVVGQDDYGLADRLERYVHGSLSGLFNRQTSVTLETSLISFDVSELRGSRELRPIGMFLIAELIWSQALFHPRPRRCYIDEAWSLIAHEEGGRFLERLAREARKHYLSLVTITQNPEQFILNPYGNIIAQNALIKVLKRLDSVGAQAAREAFGLTQEEEQLLLSIQQNRALLSVGSKRMLVEMNASPEEHALITTDPQELAVQRQQTQKEGKTV